MSLRLTTLAGSALVLIWMVIALVAPGILPHDPRQTYLAWEGASPHGGFWLGHDELGRDILSRLMLGSRVSLVVGLVVVASNLILGVVVGSVAAWFGGLAEKFFVMVVDFFQAFPGFLLAVALAAVLAPGWGSLIVVLTVSGWVGYARLARGEVLRLKEREFVVAGKALSLPLRRLFCFYLVPNMLGPLLVQATFGMAGVILIESSLSFLGLGLPPEIPSWGRMLDGGTANMLVAPHIALFPGLAIMSLVLGFNLLGDGLRDWLDPKNP